MRNYKKVSECNPLLETIIELVNILPDDAEELFNKIRVRDSAKEILNEKIVEFCFDREPETDAVERFGDLMKAKSLFRHFASLNKKFPSWKEVQKDDFELYKFLFHFISVDYKDRQFPTMLGFTKDGFIKPAKSEFLDMFEDFDIPVYRIRECPSCLKIYWAKKINSKTCGEQVCIDGLQNYKKKSNKTKKEEKTNNSFEISDKRQAERKEFLSKDFSKTE